eukprot:3672674-Rhodomonas_salina.1
MELWTAALTASGFVDLPAPDATGSKEVERSAGGNPEFFTPSFGKYKGLRLSEIPLAYLHACLEQESDGGPMADLAVPFKQYREKNPYVCTFGKYSGKTMDKVPSAYIDCAKAQDQPSNNLKELITEWGLFHKDHPSQPTGVETSDSLVHPELDPYSAFQALLSHGVHAKHVKAVGYSTSIQNIHQHQERAEKAGGIDSEHQMRGDENLTGKDEETEDVWTAWDRCAQLMDELNAPRAVAEEPRQEVAAYLEELQDLSESDPSLA